MAALKDKDVGGKTFFAIRDDFLVKTKGFDVFCCLYWPPVTYTSDLAIAIARISLSIQHLAVLFWGSDLWKGVLRGGGKFAQHTQQQSVEASNECMWLLESQLG